MFARIWVRSLGPLAFVALAALSGCDGGVGKLHPVNGKVTVDNAPLTTGSIRYHPEAPPKAGKPLEIVGNIEPDGTYKMTTNGRAGAPAGKYKVTVNTIGSGGAPAADPGATTGATAGKGKAPTPGIPTRKANEKFESEATTTLTVEVPQGPFDLQLTR